MKKYIVFYVLIAVSTAGYFGYKWDQSRKLDAYYFDQLKVIKSRMIYGSSADTQQELGKYQDHIELCMHLDGYNGFQIMEFRINTFEKAAIEGVMGKHE